MHRLQLQLQEELVRDVVISESAHLLAITPQDYGSYHPRDLLFTTDGDITREMQLTGGLGRLLRPLMTDIGAAKRRVYLEARRQQLTMFLGNDVAEFPHPLKHFAWFKDRLGNVPLIPGFVSIIAVDNVSELADFNTNDNALDFYLPALKSRKIDPLYLDERGDVQRLSQTDANFAALIVQQKQIMEQAYVGRIHVNSETRQSISSQLQANQKLWALALQRPRMPDEVMRSLLHNSVGVAAVYRMVDIDLF